MSILLYIVILRLVLAFII